MAICELIRLFKSATRMFDLATKDICGAKVSLLPVSSINS
jgi:hypothetical protein